ncbi:PH domain-containing protein [Pontimicrobium sp. MEBiC01747]
MFKNEQINIDELPTLESITYKPVSKTYLKVLLFNRVIIYAIIIMVLFVLKQSPKFKEIEFSFIPVIIAISAAFLINSIITILAFSKRGYALREHDIIYTKGLLVNKITTLPFIRIQHIEISRSFLARKLNLATLNIYSAGDSGEDLSIKGLPIDVANRLNDHITSKLNE